MVICFFKQLPSLRYDRQRLIKLYAIYIKFNFKAYSKTYLSKICQKPVITRDKIQSYYTNTRYTKNVYKKYFIARVKSSIVFASPCHSSIRYNYTFFKILIRQISFQIWSICSQIKPHTNTDERTQYKKPLLENVRCHFFNYFDFLIHILCLVRFRIPTIH